MSTQHGSARGRGRKATRRRSLLYEHRSEPILTRGAFAMRVGKSVLLASCVVFVALCIGAAGYHFTEKLAWLDAFLNASMILTGMGPVDRVQTAPGKVFAICYSIGCGFVVLSAGVLIIAPLMHRLMHRLHVEEE